MFIYDVIKPLIFVLVQVINLLFAMPVRAQPPAAAPRMDPDLLLAFEGRWQGEGQFAGGRAIAASLDFSLSLDSAWLMGQHADLAPNRFKATWMWGTDAQTGEFVAYCFDNFHGHRRFVSNGWHDRRMVLSNHAWYSKRGLVFEHFIFEMQDSGRLKMTYETSGDGVSWRLGDWLLFTRS